MLSIWILSTIAAAALFALRIFSILPKRHSVPSHRPSGDKGRPSHTLSVFLGSGGHTSEMLSLCSDLDFERYSSRKYLVSDGDSLSARKAQDLENSITNKIGHYTLFTVPRARRVHQSLFSTPPTALWSLLICTYHMMFTGRLSADVLILNGPGTCFVLCLAAYINRFLGLPSPKLIYVESFARVNKLSLSGRLLRPFVDKFIVQWPSLVSADVRGEYYGWLI